MHRYMRAIGFSKPLERAKMKELMKAVVVQSDKREYTLNTNEEMLGDIGRNFAPNLGIMVCGFFDEEDKFVYDYYFPYLKGKGITSFEDISVEQRAAEESYCGVCDEIRLGISLIFYLQNRIPYIKANYTRQLPLRGTSLTLSALSVRGMVIMPIKKDAYEIQKKNQEMINRTNLLNAAKKGDEEAIETLTMEEMDLFTAVSKKVKEDDVFSIVENYFMPYGVECDQYNILGDILACETVKNSVTGEEIYLMTICCNELTFDLAINIMDLFGEPAVGRRFKGVVWLQGFINYPEVL